MNTKSFSEQVNEVLNSECGNTAKRNELIKLGLCEHEVRMLLASITPTRTRKGEFDFSKITFGVEIESYNFCRNSLVEAGRENGLTVRSEGYNHQDNRHYFKIVSDSSISGENSNEVVSPILKGKKGMSSLKSICEALNELSAKVNRSCGLHVHIGAANMSNEHYCRIFRNYQKLESVIDSFMPVSRRSDNNRYCHTMRYVEFANCKNKAEDVSVSTEHRTKLVNYK